MKNLLSNSVFRRLNETYDKSETELKEFNSEITLEKREMMKAGLEIDRKKTRTKETKSEFSCGKWDKWFYNIRTMRAKLIS